MTRCNVIVDNRIKVVPLACLASRRVCVALIALSLLSGQEAHPSSHRVFTHLLDIETSATWREVPRWDGSLLVGFINSQSAGSIIYTINSEGQRDEILFTLKEAGYVSVIDAAASAKGEIAAVGSALGGERATSYVARIATNRTSQVVTRVWPYCPMVVTFASDGIIWTIGHIKDDGDTRITANHVLRRFDAAGKLLTSAILDVPGNSTDEISYLRSSSDRVAWFTRSGEYIEFALNGTEINRYAGPSGVAERDISGVAVSPANQVVIGTMVNGKGQFLVLDRQSREWVPVSVAPEFTAGWVRVLGFEGSSLVTTNGNGRLRRFSTK